MVIKKSNGMKIIIQKDKGNQKIKFNYTESGIYHLRYHYLQLLLLYLKKDVIGNRMLRDIGKHSRNHQWK